MIIGITGGIGAGKSVVTDHLRAKGYAIVDADEVSREAVMPGEPALSALVRAFGAGILKADGTLDRAALAALAFADECGTQKLNAILHADIIHRIKIQLADPDDRADATRNAAPTDTAPSAYNAAQLTFLSAPLLFETCLDELCDEVWLISAPEEIRVARAASRDGLSETDIRDRAAKQLGEDEKKRKAHRIIENTATRETLLREIDRLLSILLNE